MSPALAGGFLPTAPLGKWSLLTQKIFASSQEEGASQVALVVKNLPANAEDIRDADLILGLGRSPGGGRGDPLWHSCQVDPMDRGAWWATVHGVAESDTTEVTAFTCARRRPSSLS